MDHPLALVRACAITLLGAAAAPVVVSVIVLANVLYAPVPEDLPDPRPPAGRISRVFAVTGEEIGQFSEFEQHIPVDKADIPLHLKQAVVAAEDRRFYSHRGLSLRALLRAGKADAESGEIRQGGSTITQQYIKNAYTGGERSVRRKVAEAVLAGQLERKVSKDEILFSYLSSIYLGGGAYGVGAASETYFRKPVSEITISEAALLAGVIPAPSRYDPRANPTQAELKRVSVLDRMRDQGYLDAAQHAEAVKQRVYYASRGFIPQRPVTVVYPPEAPVSRYPYFVDYVRRYVENKLGRDAVYRGGLEIRTTIDPRLQEAAERAAAAALDGVAPPIEMAITAVEPQTGHVKAMVGGRDFYGPEGQVNLALGKCHRPPEKVASKVDVEATCWEQETAIEGGGTGRQPGSSWKPFVLAAALEKGMPTSKVYSAPSSYRFKGCNGDRGCVIENYEGAAGGRADLRRATAKSFNTVYAQMIQDVGVPEVGEMAKKLGIDNAWVAHPEVHGPSYAIGVQEVAPLDMASSFGVFANRGSRAPATPVLWVKDAKGKFLENNREPKAKRVIEEQVAYDVTDILKSVITEGTGTRADIGRPAAGKTGTSQEWRDAWFVGYTPTLSTAVWMGNKDRPTTMENIKGHSHVAGGTIPAETWKAFMTEAMVDVPVSDFEKPPPPPPPPPDPTSSTVTPASVFDPSTTTSSPSTTTTYEFPFDTSTTSTTTRSTTTTTSRGGIISGGPIPNQ